jgi:hypothetical protein
MITRVEQSPADATVSTPTSDTLICPECSYDLRAITSEKCPECGLPIDRAALSVSHIPWEHRKQIGCIRAYWRTHLIVLFRPSLFAEEMNRPLNYRDARLFRQTIVCLASLPLIGTAIGFYASRFGPRYLPTSDMLGWLLEGLTLVIALLSIWLFMFASTGVGSYFSHPKNMPVVRQNRAIAISFYGCAALSWVWLPATLLGMGRALLNQSNALDDLPRRVAIPLIVGAIALSWAVLIAWWARTISLMRRSTHCSLPRTLAFAIFLPVSWLTLSVLCCAIVAAFVLISLMILSLT